MNINFFLIRTILILSANSIVFITVDSSSSTFYLDTNNVISTSIKKTNSESHFPSLLAYSLDCINQKISTDDLIEKPFEIFKANLSPEEIIKELIKIIFDFLTFSFLTFSDSISILNLQFLIANFFLSILNKLESFETYKKFLQELSNNLKESPLFKNSNLFSSTSIDRLINFLNFYSSEVDLLQKEDEKFQKGKGIENVKKGMKYVVDKFSSMELVDFLEFLVDLIFKPCSVDKFSSDLLGMFSLSLNLKSSNSNSNHEIEIESKFDFYPSVCVFQVIFFIENFQNLFQSSQTQSLHEIISNSKNYNDNEILNLLIQDFYEKIIESNLDLSTKQFISVLKLCEFKIRNIHDHQLVNFFSSEPDYEVSYFISKSKISPIIILEEYLKDFLNLLLQDQSSNQSQIISNYVNTFIDELRNFISLEDIELSSSSDIKVIPYILHEFLDYGSDSNLKLKRNYLFIEHYNNSEIPPIGKKFISLFSKILNELLKNEDENIEIFLKLIYDSLFNESSEIIKSTLKGILEADELIIETLKLGINGRDFFTEFNMKDMFTTFQVNKTKKKSKTKIDEIFNEIDSSTNNSNTNSNSEKNNNRNYDHVAYLSSAELYSYANTITSSLYEGEDTYSNNTRSSELDMDNLEFSDTEEEEKVAFI